MIKLIACDLDGTLFSSFGTLSPYAKDVLQKCKDKGIIVVISSGRPYYSITNSIPEELFDYASCMNGQDIYSTKTKKHTRKPNLSKEEKKYLSSFLSKYRMMMECAFDGQGHYFADKKYFIYLEIANFIKKTIHKIKKIPHYWQDPQSNFDIIEDKEVGKVCFASTSATLRKFYAEMNHNNFSCFFVNSTWLEVMHKGISKGNALLDILEIEGIDQKDCAAFGDGENDISMLDVVGTAVAMKNAMPSVKKHASAIADTFSNDGCAKWIQKNIL